MPYAPGSGPTDPDLVARTIALGAVRWCEGHLYRDHGAHPGPRWLAVMDAPGSGPTDPDAGLMWALVTAPGLELREEDFDRLARGQVFSGLLHVDGQRYALTAPELGVRLQVARLVLVA
jgi:hypothetical protein